MTIYETLISIPVLGVGFGFLHKKINGKISRNECLRVHESLDKRLDLIHEDIKFIKGKII
jgi:hypothetical protein